MKLSGKGMRLSPKSKNLEGSLSLRGVDGRAAGSRVSASGSYVLIVFVCVHVVGTVVLCK